jgi:hypothetical protein
MSAPDVNLAACHQSSLFSILGKIIVIIAVLTTSPAIQSHIPWGASIATDKAKVSVLVTKAKP